MRTAAVPGIVVLVGGLLVASALGADQMVTTTALNKFDPPTKTIAVGDQVIWTHGGGGPHNVHFENEQPLGPTVTSGEIARKPFPTAGTFKYICDVHGDFANPNSMTGTIVVQDPSATPTPTPTPSETPVATATSTATPTATVAPTPGAVGNAAPRISGPRVARVVRGGRVRGSALVEPENARLEVRVRVAGRAAGRAVRTVAAAGRLRFTVRLGAAARRALAASGRLRATVRLKLTYAGAAATRSLTVTLRRA